MCRSTAPTSCTHKSPSVATSSPVSVASSASTLLSSTCLFSISPPQLLLIHLSPIATPPSRPSTSTSATRSKRDRTLLWIQPHAYIDSGVHDLVCSSSPSSFVLLSLYCQSVHVSIGIESSSQTNETEVVVPSYILRPRVVYYDHYDKQSKFEGITFPYTWIAR